MGLIVGVSSLHLCPCFLFIVVLITSLQFLLYPTDSRCVMLREHVRCCSLWEWAVVLDVRVFFLSPSVTGFVPL